MKGRTKWMRWAVLSVVCALVIGVYVRSANSGVIEFFGLKAENTYYNLLVQGFRAGQLNLKTEVPPGLAQLADPYNPKANISYRWKFGNPVHDLSYYQGKLYLYFGITPALVLFWPFEALTGHYLLHKDAVVIFFSTGFLAGAGLLLAVWRRYFAAVSFWIIVPCIIALGLANFTPGILTRCDVYEVSISCGYAMTMLALAGIWQALHQPQRRGRWLALASLAYGLALGARPSLLFGAVILLAPIVQAWQEKQRIWPLLMAATVPIVFIGVGLMFYNAMRFDNPLEFGLRYQLTVLPADTMEQFSPRYLWFNFQAAFLDPARWSNHFPFAHDIVVPSLPKGAYGSEHSFGVLTNIPLVWLALAVPLAWRNRLTEERSTLLWFIVAATLLFGICALTILLHFSMCIRYEVEFAHVLVLLAVIGVLALERALAGQPVWRRAARCGWGLLLTFSVAFNLFASVELHAQTHCSLGNALLGNGNVDEAISQYQQALQIDPDYADAHNNLGYTLNTMGKTDEAIAEYQKALKIQPGDAGAHYNLGIALFKEGLVDEAMVHYRKALEIQPANAEIENNLANALNKKGRVDEAIQHWQKALEIRPQYMPPQNNLAWALATNPDASLRNGEKAIQLAQQANQFTGGKNLLILQTLAAAYAEAGQFTNAIPTAGQALQLAATGHNIPMINSLQAQIRLYESGQPLHTPAN